MNPEVDWEKQTLKINLKKLKEPTFAQKVDRALQVQAIRKEQEKIESKEKFADLLRKASQRQVKKKRSKIIIEEIPDEDATPRYERLPEGERSLLIEVEQLLNAYKDMPALVPDEEDTNEEFEEELLIECLQENDIPTPDILIRAKTSISQSLTHEHETKEEKTFEDLVPKVVFAGPVRWTGKKTEIGLNSTAKDRTTGCGCTNSEFFRLTATGEYPIRAAVSDNGLR